MVGQHQIIEGSGCGSATGRLAVAVALPPPQVGLSLGGLAHALLLICDGEVREGPRRDVDGHSSCRGG